MVGGCRTPFVKAAGSFSNLSSLDLAMHVSVAASQKILKKQEHLEELVSSTVLLDPRYPNAAREIVLRSNLSNTINAHFVSNNCISGLLAFSVVANSIREGRIKCGLAVGSESMSNPTLTLSRRAEQFFLSMARAGGLAGSLKRLGAFRPGFLLPQAPSPKEPSTGLTMGEHCEITAKEYSISREVQDEIALRSHLNAAKAQASGYLAQEIAALEGVEKDNIIRKDTSAERLAKLRPVFDRSASGTITAGNASPLTDGASAVCLMDAEFARSQGYEILGLLSGLEFAAIDPSDGLLLAPVLAVPRLLKRCGLSISDIDVFEIHEAFGAQVAANLKLWKEGWPKYAEATPVGEIPQEKININGGSIALGHPFAATGGRLILSLLNELKRSDKKTGLISVCAAGAMACALILRRP